MQISFCKMQKPFPDSHPNFLVLMGIIMRDSSIKEKV